MGFFIFPVEYLLTEWTRWQKKIFSVDKGVFLIKQLVGLLFAEAFGWLFTYQTGKLAVGIKKYFEIYWLF